MGDNNLHTTMTWTIRKTTENKNPITFLSYNILADDHLQANRYLYTKCNPDHLQKSHRYDLIFKTLDSIKPDILFLQEVQETDLPDIRKNLATQLNHNLFFTKRPNGKPDGCSISYNKEKFMPLHFSSEHYNLDMSTGFNPVDYSQNCKLPGISDNTGLIVVLQDLDDVEKVLILANTHLVYSPNRGHIKIWQITKLVFEILRVKKVLQKEHGISEESIGIILGGDLNSVLKSPLCQYLDGNNLDMSEVSLKQVSGQKFDKNPKPVMEKINESGCEDLVVIPFQNKTELNIIEAKINFERVYNADQNTDKATTISTKFYDHIFCKNIDIFSELQIPEDCYYIPNENHGSDHVPIGMQFLYK